MVLSGNYFPSVSKVAFIGSYVPRQCGIATFTKDLLTSVATEAPNLECWAIAMNDIANGYDYPKEVRFEINQKILKDYELAADFLNINRVDVVSLQHEYGIFGGGDGVYILELLGQLRMPVVSTLHTVLEKPSMSQYSILKRITEISDKVVVMSQKATEILRKVYSVPKEKILFIPHGIPDVAFVDPNYYKDQFGVAGKKVILTFGLLSPNKGIEGVIQALPSIIEKHPDVVYVIVGATHPHVKRESGESYRLSLQRLARKLGVDDHIIFHNRFVTLEELCEFLGTADVYVTPYLNKEQIVSGTLAYALGTGKAVVSTPYWYAEEMLSEKRGILVPFKDPQALSGAINYLLDNEIERHAIRKKAYNHCRNMVWKEVARKYLEAFEQAKAERESRPKVVFLSKSMARHAQEVPQPNLRHLLRLTDDVGILQHASYIVPHRKFGYCTDDNARALCVLLLSTDLDTGLEEDKVLNLICTYLGFLLHAFDENRHRFRNFMDYSRCWQEELGSEDSHGRAILALGEAVLHAPSSDVRGMAMELFQKALSPLEGFTSPRAWAMSLIGVASYLKAFPGDREAKRIMEILAERLWGLYKSNAAPDWIWPEDILAYANGTLPHGLIVAGLCLQRKDMLEMGLDSLRWLMDLQTDKAGHFSPIGNNGWYKRGTERARFDQQPIEAQVMIEAMISAYEATKDELWINKAQTCLDWFLGRNDLQVSLYDYHTGGCYDGLTPTGPNRNQGAESTLAWLLALLHILKVRSRQVSINTGGDSVHLELTA